MKMTVEERERFLRKLKPSVNRGDYKAALVLTKAFFKKYPDDFTARYQYAKILGDWADELPDQKQAKVKIQAVQILRPLLNSLRSQPAEERFGICLNYYYQSKNWPAMLAFGKRQARTNPQKSLYAQGLSKTLMASDLRESGAGAASRRWASKAVRDWTKYNFKAEKYYFPHYCFAKALALSDDPTRAMNRLKTAAKLGKRKVSDWEFADVLEICADARKG